MKLIEPALNLVLATMVTVATLSGMAHAAPPVKKSVPAKHAMRSEVFASIRGSSLNFQILRKQNPEVYIVEKQSARGKKSKKIPAGLAATIRADILNFIWTQEFTAPKTVGKCTITVQLEVKQSNDLTKVCREDQVAQRKLVVLSDRLTRLIEN